MVEGEGFALHGCAQPKDYGVAPGLPQADLLSSTDSRVPNDQCLNRLKGNVRGPSNEGGTAAGFDRGSSGAM
jgi:hypothetical protein